MPLIESRSDVPVTIDASLCIEGCTLCVDICPLDSLAIHPETGKAYMHVDECWYCGPWRPAARSARSPSTCRTCCGDGIPHPGDHRPAAPEL